MRDIKQMFDRFCRNGGTMSGLSRDIGENKTYISKALSGWDNYKLSPERKAEIEDKILKYLSLKVGLGNEYEDICKKAGILEFDNTVNIFASVIKCIKQHALMSITAKSGTGKTTAIRALRDEIPQMILVTAYDGMRPKELLEDILSGFGESVLPKNVKDLMRKTKQKLGNAKKVIVIDEANFITQRSLEQLRHIHDVCDVAIVFVGTEKLMNTITSSHEQVVSRIRASLPLRTFSEVEVLKMAEDMELECDEKLALRVWKKCRNLREVRYLFEDCCEKKTTIKEEL